MSEEQKDERMTNLMRDLMDLIDDLNMSPNQLKRMRPIVREINLELKKTKIYACDCYACDYHKNNCTFPAEITIDEEGRCNYRD